LQLHTEVNAYIPGAACELGELGFRANEQLKGRERNKYTER
jgi:hypothetical protein